MSKIILKAVGLVFRLLVSLIVCAVLVAVGIATVVVTALAIVGDVNWTSATYVIAGAVWHFWFTHELWSDIRKLREREAYTRRWEALRAARIRDWQQH